MPRTTTRTLASYLTAARTQGQGFDALAGANKATHRAAKLGLSVDGVTHVYWPAKEGKGADVAEALGALLGLAGDLTQFRAQGTWARLDAATLLADLAEQAAHAEAHADPVGDEPEGAQDVSEADSPAGTHTPEPEVQLPTPEQLAEASAQAEAERQAAAAAKAATRAPSTPRQPAGTYLPTTRDDSAVGGAEGLAAILAQPKHDQVTLRAVVKATQAWDHLACNWLTPREMKAMLAGQYPLQMRGYEVAREVADEAGALAVAGERDRINRAKTAAARAAAKEAATA